MVGMSEVLSLSSHKGLRWQPGFCVSASLGRDFIKMLPVVFQGTVPKCQVLCGELCLIEQTLADRIQAVLMLTQFMWTLSFLTVGICLLACLQENVILI